MWTCTAFTRHDGRAMVTSGVLPNNLGNMLSQQLLKRLLLFNTLKHSPRNHRELTRAVVEQVGISIDKRPCIQTPLKL